MRRYRLIRVVLFATGLVATAPTRVRGQIADYYRGTVVNDAHTGEPADLELFVFSRSDSTTAGFLKVGPPLGGSGVTGIVRRDMDSLYLVTMTPEGDTIVWASPQHAGTLEGRYWIRGARYAGQGGRWRLVPAPRMSQAALVLFSLGAGALLVLGIAAASAASYPRWWAWRLRRAGPATANERHTLNAVAGWLGWVTFTHSCLAIYALVTIGQIVSSFGGSWMFASAIDGMRSELVLEAIGHFFQTIGVIVGLVLLWRRSQLAPVFWVLLLVLAGGYAIYDLSASADVGRALTAVFGSDSTQMLGSIRDADTQNQRMVWSAIIWSLYWIKSRRVLVVFGPPAPPAAEAPPDDVTRSVAVPEGATVPRPAEPPSSVTT